MPRLAQTPRMWLTHPPNREREDSAKDLPPPRRRPAWELFAVQRNGVNDPLLDETGLAINPE